MYLQIPQLLNLLSINLGFLLYKCYFFPLDPDVSVGKCFDRCLQVCAVAPKCIWNLKSQLMYECHCIR